MSDSDVDLTVLQTDSIQAKKLNDAVYELYSPAGREAELDIVFFHGLQLRDYYQAYKETWLSAKADECWPQTWLARDFPRARILSVSYDSAAIRGAKQGNMDMEATGQSLVDLLILQAGVGQSCCTILVGHSLGGLVIKQVCLKAESIFKSDPSAAHLQKFLKSVRGIFFYATPHHGSGLASVLGYLPWYPSPLLKYLAFLNTETESLNDRFCELRWKYDWKAYGLGEARAVFLPGLSRGLIIVPEVSARCDMDYFAQLGEDHVTICKPTGTSVSSYQHLMAFILSIVGKVHLCEGVPLYAAGLHSQVEAVKQLVDEEPLVAVLGMAGIGKTTIAKAVFNTISYNFDFTCFINNIKSHQSCEKVNARILASLYQQGRRLKNCEGDWSILKGRKVLLVMDDVSSSDQVQSVLDAGWFTKDSRVIITAREIESLNLFKFSTYSVRTLNDESSKKVFCQYAFRDPKVPAELKYLKKRVKKAVEKCGGLPLLLQVIGSSLYRPKFEEYKDETWAETMTSLSDAEMPDDSFEMSMARKLRVSYNILESHEQAMFLDVATISRELPVSRFQALWSPWGELAESGWLNLIDKSLVKPMRQGRFQEEVACMHNAFRDLGRTIALESESRVFDHGKGTHALTFRGKEKAQGLMLRGWKNAWGADLDISFIAKMSELRFLILKNVPVSGSCDKLPQSLSLVQWRSTSSSTHHLRSLSHLTKLTVLELDSRAQKNKGNLDEVAEDISSLTELRFLKLEGNFAHLPSNFGDLQSVQHVTLSSGMRLTSLPDSFGYLSSLQELVISNTGLTTLPDSFGRLSCLRKLRLECFHLSVLPDSFGKLLSLEILHLFCCEEIEKLPDSFGELFHLHFLEINVCPKLKELPESFGQLGSLKIFRLSYCQNLKWPSMFGPLSSLIKLELTGFDSLPESLGQLVHLKKLRLSDIDGKNFPSTFGELASLELLQIQRCPYIAVWHLELQKMEWVGFQQRIAQQTESSKLEVFVYLRSGHQGFEPEKVEETANWIITKHFPHPSRWEWPKAVAIGPVLRRSYSDGLYGRSLSQLMRA